MIIALKRTLLNKRRWLAFGGLVLLVMLSLTRPLEAQTVTQGYEADSALQRGLLVQLNKDKASRVEPVVMQTAERLLGVVVDANDSPVTISQDGEKVFVATTGRYDVLVSDQDGPLTKGSYIAVGALDGIGKLAGGADKVVVGRALADFDGKSNVLSTTEVKDSAGSTKQVHIGRIAADISIGHNPLQKSEVDLPGVLQRAAKAVAGKPVDLPRIYLSLVVFLICAIISASLMYSGIRSGLISIGRNPLGKKSIIRGMLQVILTALIIFITGIIAVYLLLKL
jgi:hypothetical protein